VASSTTPEKLNEAITYIQDKMAQNPNGNLAAVVVESLIMSGKQADAEAALNQYLGEYPDHSELNHLKAAKQIMQGNWREGQESALRSLRLDQDLKRVEKRGQSYAEEALMAGEVNSAERMIQEMENRQISSEVIDILKKEIEEAKKAQRPNPK